LTAQGPDPKFCRSKDTKTDRQAGPVNILGDLAYLWVPFR
jgi:hypothetical protein